MIIKGKARSGAGQLARYLQLMEQNERVSVLAIDGTVAQDVAGALNEMSAIAKATRCEKPLYHVQISPQPGYPLSPDQVARSVTVIADHLGFQGQPYVLVAHVKHERAHYHVVYSRIDAATLTAKPIAQNWPKHNLAARQLEAEFGHPRLRDRFTDPKEQTQDLTRSMSFAEVKQAERKGSNARTVRAEVTALYQRSDTPAAFVQALSDAGYRLAQGDRPGVPVLIDSHGAVQGLARRIEGVRTKELRAFLAPIYESLPPASRLDAPQQQGAPALTREDMISDETRQALLTKLSDTRLDTVERASAMTTLEKDRLARMAEMKEQLRAFESARDQDAERARAPAAAPPRGADQPREAGDRYAQALAKHYSMSNPYESLARASMEEWGVFKAEQERLKERIGAEKNPEKRKDLTIRKEIEWLDYMTVTSKRIEGISYVVTGRKDTPDQILMRERVAEYAPRAKVLREELADRTAAREKTQEAAKRERQDAAPAKSQEAHKDKAAPDRASQPQGATRAQPPARFARIEEGRAKPISPGAERLGLSADQDRATHARAAAAIPGLRPAVKRDAMSDRAHEVKDKDRAQTPKQRDAPEERDRARQIEASSAAHGRGR